MRASTESAEAASVAPQDRESKSVVAEAEFKAERAREREDEERQQTAKERAVYDAIAQRERRDHFVSTVCGGKLDVTHWVGRLYDRFPEQYEDPKWLRPMLEEPDAMPMLRLLSAGGVDEEDVEAAMKAALKQMRERGKEGAQEKKEEKKQVEADAKTAMTAPSSSDSAGSMHVCCQSVNPKKKAQGCDDAAILPFLARMATGQKVAFTKHIRELVRKLHHDVHGSVASEQREIWQRTKHMQVISDRDNEVRLRNMQRIAFKAALGVYMPEFIRKAAATAMQVPLPPDSEEHVHTRDQLFGALTKPSSGVDFSRAVNKIEAFQTHYASSICPLGVGRGRK